jgi:hypothetical protein
MVEWVQKLRNSAKHQLNGCQWYRSFSDILYLIAKISILTYVLLFLVSISEGRGIVQSTIVDIA